MTQLVGLLIFICLSVLGVHFLHVGKLTPWSFTTYILALCIVGIGFNCVDRLKEINLKELSLILEKTEKAKEEITTVKNETIDEARKLALISQLGSRARWQNAYGGDRPSYETLLSMGKMTELIKKAFDSEMETIESVYSLNITIPTIEQVLAICKFITMLGKQPCSEGFEPSVGYNTKNVFDHLEYPLWTERARAACLLRNVRSEQNTNKEWLNQNKEEFYDRLITHMKKEKENSLFVSVMALNTYKELTGYPSSGIFDFDGAIKDWNNTERRGKIIDKNF